MTVTLTGDQDHVQYKPTNLAEDVVATGATFHVRQSPAFLYPIDIRNTSGRTWTGGKWIADDIDQLSDWETEYAQGNSAAFRIENSQNFTAKNGWFDGIWDGFRPSGTACNGWLLQGWLGENIRDDFVENDACNSGTIRDCMVDGAYVSCMSTTDGGSTTKANKTITIEDSLFKSKAYLVEGVANQHGSPFKVSKTGTGYNPTYIVNRCVFAILRPDHNMSEPGGRLSFAFQNMTVTASYWLNLSDTPLGSAYLGMIPAGFTVLQGQAARDMWTQKRSAWRVAHGYDEGTPPPPPPPDGDDGPTQAEFDALVARVTAIEADVPYVTQAELDALAARVAALEGATPPASEVTQAELDALAARVAALEAATPPATEVTQAELDAVIDRVAALESATPPPQSEVTQAELDAVVARVAAAEAAIAAHEGRLDAISSGSAG